MEYLLSLPPNLVNHFHSIAKADPKQWYCTSDPVDARLGSGGGTVWLMQSCHEAQMPQTSFEEWLQSQKHILLHAGGQGRRIPAYSPSGKILTPIPVFRWERGQRIDQTLLDFQVPFYERIMKAAPKSLHTLIASGDVLIRATDIGKIPEADVVCFGMWEEPSLAKNHGVFMISRDNPTALDHMLQKPSPQQLGALAKSHYFLMDIGVWLLSDKAVERLRQLSTNADGSLRNYDLYSDFGTGLGTNPSQPEPLLADLSVKIIPLDDGEFYHYGTSRELLSSTTTLMNYVKDQRLIMHHSIKQHPSIFTQNAIVRSSVDLNQPNIWIENSYLPSSWSLAPRSIITGVPINNWNIELRSGQCVDIVPIGDNEYALRPYGFEDAFRGPLDDPSVTFLEEPVTAWLAKRGITLDDFNYTADIQRANLFPVCNDLDTLGQILNWFISEEPDMGITSVWRQMPRLSADGISNQANLQRLNHQRKSFQSANIVALAKNYNDSIFYQLDLKDVAEKFKEYKLDTIQPLDPSAPLMTRIHDAMLRSHFDQLSGKDGSAQSEQAFSLLQQGMIQNVLRQKCLPQLDVCPDQIVWGRSPVRVDVAGGWTDTPPYSLYSGGNVVNFAITLNGQPPLQVYVKPNKDFNIVCRSIDLGAQETITTYEELSVFNKVGSPFSIPKAALALAGFLPAYCQTNYSSLRAQLEDFGSGIEITLLSAIPAGSGLGTSSILAATVLGAVSDFCRLGWTKPEICNRTLVLEQLLTTGGGWQDQYGGVLHSIKLLQSNAGFDQNVSASWLPETLFRHEEGACHLLYYTGITRTAKNILADIVKGMFLNDADRLAILNEMKGHALNMSDAIQRGDFQTYGQLLRNSWELNCRLDPGTAPDSVNHLCSLIDDLCLGYKLPGAGGGGYMYMLAKDPEAAVRLRQLLNANPMAPNARFVEMALSDTGLQVSRS